MNFFIFLILAAFAYPVTMYSIWYYRRYLLSQIVRNNIDKQCEYFVSVSGDTAIAMDMFTKSVSVFTKYSGEVKINLADIILCEIIEDNQIGSNVSGRVRLGLFSHSVTTTVSEGGKIKRLSLKLKIKNSPIPVLYIDFLRNLVYVNKQSRLAIFYNPYKRALSLATKWQDSITILTHN